MLPVLTKIEARVLGCLIEKEHTTPDYYPMTLNGLIAACNQKSNREPVMAISETMVSEALSSLRYEHHLVWQVTTTGSRVAKYKHDVVNGIALADEEVALLCLLMLRGPQTIGELRTRTARLYEFDDLTQVADTLNGLQDPERGAMVSQLPRQPGRRERRYAHLLCGDVDVPADKDPGPAAGEPEAPPVRQDDRVDELSREVAELRAQVSELKEQFSAFRPRNGS